jgi:hypothetical protein
MADVKQEHDDSATDIDHELDATLEDSDISTLAARSLIILREFPRLPPANPHMRDRHAKAREATTRAYHRVDREGAPVIRALFTVVPPADDPADPLAPPPADDPDAVPAEAYAGPYLPYDPLVPASRAPRHSTRYATKRATACALTGAHARYRDAGTGLPYASARAYASIRRLMGGRARVSWSETFQCWIDDRRPAAGVPRDVWDPEAEERRKRRKAREEERRAAAQKAAAERKAEEERRAARRTTRSTKDVPATTSTVAGTKRLRSAVDDASPGPAAKTVKTAAAERSRRSVGGKK